MTDPAILVVAEHRDGIVTDSSREAVGAALSACRDDSQDVSVLIVGNNQELASALSYEGVSRIIMTDNAPSQFDPLVYEEAIIVAAERLRPRLIVVPHSVDSMGYAPALAIRAGCGFCSDAVDLTMNDGNVRAVRTSYGNRLAMEIAFPDHCMAVVTLRGATFPPPSAQTSVPFEALSIELPQTPTTHIELRQVESAGVDIAKANFILSIGRGVKDQESIAQFQSIAERLGAILGCSRPIADAGWLPKAHQVGQSGQTASSCKLYLALGISGAAQHLHGMKHVECVVAVNSDPNAPIFQHAKYGICADLFEFAAALEKQFN